MACRIAEESDTPRAKAGTMTPTYQTIRDRNARPTARMIPKIQEVAVDRNLP